MGIPELLSPLYTRSHVAPTSTYCTLHTGTVHLLASADAYCMAFFARCQMESKDATLHAHSHALARSSHCMSSMAAPCPHDIRFVIWTSCSCRSWLENNKRLWLLKVRHTRPREYSELYRARQSLGSLRRGLYSCSLSSRFLSLS